MTEGMEGFAKSLSNITFDRTAGSHSLAAAGQRARYTRHESSGGCRATFLTRAGLRHSRSSVGRSMCTSRSSSGFGLSSVLSSC